MFHFSCVWIPEGGSAASRNFLLWNLGRCSSLWGAGDRMRVPLSFSREAVRPERGRFRKNSCLWAPAGRQRAWGRGRASALSRHESHWKQRAGQHRLSPAQYKRPPSGRAASDPPAQEEGRQVCLWWWGTRRPASSKRSSLGTGLRGDSAAKASTCNAGGLGSLPGSGRSPAEGNGSPLQYSCLENLMDRGAWRATVHAVTESDTTERWTRSLSLSKGPESALGSLSRRTRAL